jgi:hypothetical protein
MLETGIGIGIGIGITDWRMEIENWKLETKEIQSKMQLPTELSESEKPQSAK